MANDRFGDNQDVFREVNKTWMPDLDRRLGCLSSRNLG